MVGHPSVTNTQFQEKNAPLGPPIFLEINIVAPQSNGPFLIFL